MTNISKDSSGAGRKSTTQKTTPSKGTAKKSTDISPAKSTQAKASATPRTDAARPNARTVTQEQRRQMIAEAAYYRAEKRGFTGADPMADWLEAEAEVDRYLLQG